MENDIDPRSRQILTEVFKLESFRSDQENVIDTAVKGIDSLVMMPTGMGKSLCFQIPARIFDGRSRETF